MVPIKLSRKELIMKFYQLDPRPQGAEANEKIFAKHTGHVLGIEVTVPSLAAKCRWGNLDHHGPDDTAETPSAAEKAIDASVAYWGPEPKFGPRGQESLALEALVTIRPDADSITAMAVLANRQIGRLVDENLVHEVGRFDRFGPSAGKPSAVVTAIARKACDFKLSLADRVQWVSDLLASADKTAEIAALNAAHDAELEAARKASELTLNANGRIACVVSTHRFATGLGYENALVVVAVNPAMVVDPKDASKGVYRKFTVCRYDSHVPCDLPAALKELQALEAGWGGRGDIFGSPQGVSSKLEVEQVIEVVSRHLK